MLTGLQDLPEWYEFRNRYQYNIFAFAVEVLGMDGTERWGKAESVTWQQFELFDSIRFPGSRTTVSSGHGCFGLGTKVMRSSGEIANVEDIREGDTLMGDDGQSIRNVLELKRGQENMYRFTYADGTSHVFNESHILCLVATNSKGRRVAGTKTTVTVREWLTWGFDKKRCHAIYRSPVTAFDNALSTLPIPPYILGLWLGDGHTKATAFTTEDFEIKASLLEYAQSIGCDLVKHSNSGNAETLNITKKIGVHGKVNPMREALRQLGVFESKHIPEIYLHASLENRRQLLAGLIDTDGSLDGCSYDFVQKSRSIAHDVCWLARSIGCHATIKQVTKKCGNNGVVGQYWRVTIGRNTAQIPVRISHKKRPDLPEQRNNLHFSIKSVEPLGLGDYYGFVLDGNSQFLGGDFTVLHNTGKTRSMAIVSLWHLLCFPHSVTMFTAPQIQQLRNQTWKEISICYMRLKNGPYSWLADYIKILAERVYIIGHPTTWHILAKTAPKNSPTNIAGQHGDYLLIWGDEASGIEDKVLDTLSGALTDARNRMVLTSQPTRGAGFFFDTHHRLSRDAIGKDGKRGRWVNIVMNSELSPIVTPSFLAEMLEKYGSRDDPLYQIRVLGLFPDLTKEFLAGRKACESAYAGTCIHGTDRYGYVIAVDVGGGVGRDDSVIAVGKVSGDGHHGDGARKVEVVDIPLCDNTSNITLLLNTIDHQMSLYANATLVVDANGAGRGLAQKLQERGIPFQEVNWGGQCFDEQAKADYANKRSQAIVCLGRAITEGRFKIFTPVGRPKVLEQISRLPYTFDNRARWYVLTKEQMSMKGIKSPDIADVFAFMFMDDVMPIPVESVSHVSSGVVSDAIERLKAAAAARG